MIPVKSHEPSFYEDIYTQYNDTQICQFRPSKYT